MKIYLMSYGPKIGIDVETCVPRVIVEYKRKKVLFHLTLQSEGKCIEFVTMKGFFICFYLSRRKH